MDTLPSLGEIGYLVERLAAESAALRAEARAAVAACRQLRLASREHARELRAIGAERVTWREGG
jgi:hypothetical protein